MGDVNFYLKKAVKSTGKSLIFLSFRYNGNNRLVYSFGQTIDAANWNSEKQRVKSNRLTTQDGQNSLNDLLDNLTRITKTSYNNEIKNGVPDPDKLRKYLDEFLSATGKGKVKKAEPDFFGLIDRFISGEIKNAGKDKSQRTLNNYKNTRKHLQLYQQKTRTKITFDSITLDFFYNYISFLKTLEGRNGERLSHNTKAMGYKEY